jgi:hypothetical protein
LKQLESHTPAATDGNRRVPFLICFSFFETPSTSFLVHAPRREKGDREYGTRSGQFCIIATETQNTTPNTKRKDIEKRYQSNSNNNFVTRNSDKPQNQTPFLTRFDEFFSRAFCADFATHVTQPHDWTG